MHVRLLVHIHAWGVGIWHLGSVGEVSLYIIYIMGGHSEYSSHRKRQCTGPAPGPVTTKTDPV